MLDRMNALMAGGPSAWTPEQLATMGRLRDAAMKDPYALDELRHLTDNIGPRISGSPQAQQAVEYVAAEMRALGADVTLEKAKVPHWVRGAETAELVSWPGQTPGTTQKVVLTALGGSVATPPEGITAEVVVVDNWAQLKALPPGAVKGKILLFNHPFDKELAAEGQGLDAYVGGVVYRGGGPIAGGAVGAVAVLVRSVGGADFRLPHTGETEYAPDVPKVPAAAVTAEDADMLKVLAGEGQIRLHLTLTPQTLPDAESYNVIADWKGTEHPEQVVIVSGHLDSWDLGTGAIDDGAGVVVSMQVIHLLQGAWDSSQADGAVCGVDVRGRRVARGGAVHGRPQGRCGEPCWRDRVRPWRGSSDWNLLCRQAGTGQVAAAALRCAGPDWRGDDGRD